LRTQSADRVERFGCGNFFVNATYPRPKCRVALAAYFNLKASDIWPVQPMG
jgi:hypothetical protein